TFECVKSEDGSGLSWRARRWPVDPAGLLEQLVSDHYVKRADLGREFPVTTACIGARQPLAESVQLPPARTSSPSGRATRSGTWRPTTPIGPGSSTNPLRSPARSR